MKRYTIAALLSVMAGQALSQTNGANGAAAAGTTTSAHSHDAAQSIVSVPTSWQTTLAVAGVGDTIGSFDPEIYIDSVLGVQPSPTTANGVVDPRASHNEAIRQDLRRQLNLRKQEMMHDYASEMFDLQLELEEIALQLQYCNWDCVTQCSAHAIDIRSKSHCLESCSCYSGSGISSLALQNQQAYAYPVSLYSQASGVATAVPNTAYTNGATNGAAVNGNTAATSPLNGYASLAHQQLQNQLRFAQAERRIEAEEDAKKFALEQQEAASELQLEAQIQQQELERQRRLHQQELEFQQAELTLEREQQALELSFQTQKHQLELGLLTGTSNSAALIELINTQRQQQLTLDAKRLDLERQRQLAIAQAEAEEYQYEIAVHEQKLQRDFQFEEQLNNLEFQAELQQQTLIEEQQRAYAASLPPQFQQLLDVQNQRAREEILRDRLNEKVELALERVLESKTATHAQFKAVLDQSALSLGCDAACVNQCSSFRLTMEDQANCLDICLCYATPEERALLQAQLGASRYILNGATGLNGAAVNGAATNGVATNGAAVNGAAVNGAAVNGAAVNGAVNGGIALNQIPHSYDAVTTMALFAGILIIAMAAFHFMKKNKKGDKKEPSPFDETAYSLLQA